MIFKRKKSEEEPPIQNLDHCDILAVRKDGGVEMTIIASGKLDCSPETQRRLLDKIEHYLAYMASDEFRAEFGELPADKRVIRLLLCEGMDERIKELLNKIPPWVQGSNATFRYEFREKMQ